MSSRASSSNSGVIVNNAVRNMPPIRKTSGKAEYGQGDHAFSSSLEILEPGDNKPTLSSSQLSLGSRSRPNLGQVPPRSDSSHSQRVTTPTKHVSLTAVRRKQDVESPIEPELDWREFTRSTSRLSLGNGAQSSTFPLTETQEDDPVVESEEALKEDQACALPSASTSGVSSQTEVGAGEREKKEKTAQKETQENSNNNKDSGDDEDDDDDDDDSDSDEEPRKAPNELLMEFLDCVMKKDFKNAEKLCRMILIYEPSNKEALTFHPVILEKLELEREAAEAGEDTSGDDDDEDDDDDDDDDDSKEDSSLDSSSTNDEEEEEGGAENNLPQDVEPLPRSDSGIGM